MTTHEYEDGVVVRSVTVREPEFSDWDRALLIADHKHRTALRGTHGILMSEATDPKNQFAYRVKPPITDWAEKALREAKAAYQKQWPSADMHALMWELEDLSVASEEELGSTEG